jgi:hypothetical protein
MLEGIGRFTHTRHGFCVVSLCQGQENNETFFAFVAIEPHNYGYFKKCYEKGQANDFTAFGRELLRGPGLVPSQEVIDHIRSKYNIEFDVDKCFVERLVAVSTTTNTSKNSASTESSPFPLKPAEAQGSS